MAQGGCALALSSGQCGRRWQGEDLRKAQLCSIAVVDEVAAGAGAAFRSLDRDLATVGNAGEGVAALEVGPAHVRAPSRHDAASGAVGEGAALDERLVGL